MVIAKSCTTQERDDAIEHVFVGHRRQDPDLSAEQTLMRGEQLAGPGVADTLQRTLGEVIGRQLDRQWVGVWIACNLAQHEISAAGEPQHECRSKLGARKVGERKSDKDYGAG